jgi:hypothetical protein
MAGLRLEAGAGGLGGGVYSGYLTTSTEWFERLRMLAHLLDGHPEIAEVAYRDAEKRCAWHGQASVISRTLFP